MGCRASKEDPAYLAGLEVFRRYEFVLLRGRGGTSQVHEVADKESGESFAVKCVVKKEAAALGRTDPERDAKEKWAILDHPNICKLHCCFQDPDLQYFVMELCEGGTFFERLEEEIVLEEVEAERIGHQMISAVAHLHEKGVCHRDLKPESWMMSEPSPEARIKLINFGLAELCKEEDELTTPCGTLHYTAPEVLRGRYGKKADNWTLGVVLFLSMYAAYPFDGESCTSVMQSVLGAEPEWSDSCYALSPEARDLLRQLLTKDPCLRPSASEALRHQWFALNSGRRAQLKTQRTLSKGKSRQDGSVADGTTPSLNSMGVRRSVEVSTDSVLRWSIGQQDDDGSPRKADFSGFGPRGQMAGIVPSDHPFVPGRDDSPSKRASAAPSIKQPAAAPPLLPCVPVDPLE